MVFSLREREFKFRKFIKMRAKELGDARIIREVGINDDTLREWKRIDDNEEQFLTLPRKGGPKRKTTDDDDQTLRTVALNRKWKRVPKLKKFPELVGNENIQSVSDITIKRRLREQGVRRRIAAKKQLHRGFHITNRLNYANEFKNWTLNEWQRVIFIDEFKYCTGDPGRHWVWRTTGTRFDQDNIVSIQNSPRYSVSFIVCFSFHGIGPICRVDRLTSESYIDYLENQLLDYIDEKYDDGVVLLLHDNHPVHTSTNVKNWINANIGKRKTLYFHIPDLNPVEHVGGLIKGIVRGKRPIVGSNDELWLTIERAHEKMKKTKWRPYFIKLLESMPRRLQEVIRNQGRDTSY